MPPPLPPAHACQTLATNSVKPTIRALTLERKEIRERDQGCTDVASVELVDSDEGGDGRAAEQPRCERADHGELALVQVVDEDRIKLQDERIVCVSMRWEVEREKSEGSRCAETRRVRGRERPTVRSMEETQEGTTR